MIVYESSSSSYESSENSDSDDSDDSSSGEKKPYKIEDDIDETTWFFESYDHYNITSDIDIFIFWSSQVAASVF